MQFEIFAEEQQLLLDLLQTELGNIRQEIHHTETYEYRDKLKAREVLIRELIQKFKAEKVSA